MEFKGKFKVGDIVIISDHGMNSYEWDAPTHPVKVDEVDSNNGHDSYDTIIIYHNNNRKGYHPRRVRLALDLTALEKAIYGI